MKKHILWLAAALTLLFCMALPAAAEGEEETIPAPSPAAEDAVTLIPEEALAAELVDSTRMLPSSASRPRPRPL